MSLRTEKTEADYQLAAANLGVGSVTTTLHNLEYHAKSGHLPENLTPENAAAVFDMCTRLADAVQQIVRIQGLLGDIPRAETTAA